MPLERCYRFNLVAVREFKGNSRAEVFDDDADIVLFLKSQLIS